MFVLSSQFTPVQSEVIFKTKDSDKCFDKTFLNENTTPWKRIYYINKAKCGKNLQQNRLTSLFCQKMSEFFNVADLVNLFNPPKTTENDSDSDLDDINNENKQKNLGENNQLVENNVEKISPYSKIDKEPKHDEEIKKAIEDNGLISESSSEPFNRDWKKTPKWELSYRQQVSASDVFLQMGAKNPSTASCENMIVAIHLPGEHMQNIDIKVLRDKIEVDSPNFYLNLPLPHNVNPQLGNAQWEKDEEKLIATLQMEREFDFINF